MSYHARLIAQLPTRGWFYLPRKVIERARQATPSDPPNGWASRSMRASGGMGYSNMAVTLSNAFFHQ